MDDRRRTRTINVAALIASALTIILSVPTILVFAASSEWLPLMALNVLLLASYGLGLVANARGRNDLAMWIVLLTGLVNVSASVLVFGSASGAAAFFIVIPLAAVLASSDGDLRARLVITGLTIGSLGIMVWIDPDVPERIAGTSIEWLLPFINISSVVLFAVGIALHFRLQVIEAEAELIEARQRSDALLLNILPIETADRLKAGESVIADFAEDVSILFADLVGSAPMSEALEPEAMVRLLNEVFSAFDDLADRFGVEKIKTFGDAYIVVGGLPTERSDHLEAVADMALAMRDEITRHSSPETGVLDMRFGIHVGSVVAGVIGKRKFSYDLWGDAVNTASRMESHGVPGRIQTTATVERRLRDMFILEERGEIDVKGKGMMTTFFLTSRR